MSDVLHFFDDITHLTALFVLLWIVFEGIEGCIRAAREKPECDCEKEESA